MKAINQRNSSYSCFISCRISENNISKFNISRDLFWFFTFSTESIDIRFLEYNLRQIESFSIKNKSFTCSIRSNTLTAQPAASAKLSIFNINCEIHFITVYMKKTNSFFLSIDRIIQHTVQARKI